MNFTIARSDLESLLKAAGIARQKKSDCFVLSACVARVFVEFAGDVAGTEALVLADGAVTLSAKPFRRLIATYTGKRFLRFEASADGLQIERLHVPILRYDPDPQPPGNFKVFPVTDSAVGQPPPPTSRSA